MHRVTPICSLVKKGDFSYYDKLQKLTQRMSKMGMGRKKSELKMRRRKSQAKLKARIQKRIVAGAKKK
jgi:hypothetical protein